ncbi:MAG: hypothetical protein KIT41_14245 [Pyrinomonadaceae bacterium]|nr:hypothetical protein [Pyrinomonadaceae bacterium]
MSRTIILAPGQVPLQGFVEQIDRAEEAEQRRMRQVSLGWETEIVAPAGGLAALATPQPEVQVVSVNLEEFFRPQDAGSWVVVLTAEVIESVLGVSNITPLIASVEMGAGGTRQRFECDATRAVIPSPCGTLRVSVFWDTLNAEYLQRALSTNKALPPRVIVRATVQRSFAVSKMLTRTFRAFPSVSVAQFNLPTLARSWYPMSGWVDDMSGGGWSVWEGSQEPFTVGSLVDRDTDLPRIQRWARNACPRNLHPNANLLRWGVRDAETSLIVNLGL